MYSVLIVDDEQIIRSSIASMLNRMQNEAIGPVHTCASCEEAVQFCASHHPDIVITDIVMGEKTGIDLLGALNSMLTGTHYLVISGYDNYSYVRSAFNEGAVDYLLKPVLYPEFKGIIEKMISQLDRTQVSAFNAAFRRLILSLADNGSSVDFNPGFRDHGPERIYDIALAAYPTDDEAALERIGARLCAETFADAELAFLRQGSCMYMAFLTAQPRADLADRLTRDVIRAADAGCRPAVVADSCRMADFPGAFYRLQRCAAMRLRGGYGSVYIPGSGDDDAGLLPACFGAINDLLNLIDSESPDRICDRMCDLFRKVRVCDLQNAYRAFTSIVRQHMIQRGINGELPVFPDFQSFLFEKDLFAAIRGILQGCAEGRRDEYSDLVALIRRYIEDNYDRRLSLSDAADHFSVSYAHLSHVFSTAMGIPFTEYVTLTRMKHARRLIYDPKYTVQEIAFLCGYENQFSFTRAFKRYYGISPSGYRKALEQTIIR